MLLLKEVSGEQRSIEIWIGAVEAGAIAFAEQGIKSERPLTHELLVETLSSLNVSIVKVAITELIHSIFIAELVLSSGAKVSARPSDAVAIALRANCPIDVSESVLTEAAVKAGAAAQLTPDDDIEAFKSFLDNLNPEDFGA